MMSKENTQGLSLQSALPEHPAGRGTTHSDRAGRRGGDPLLEADPMDVATLKGRDDIRDDAGRPGIPPTIVGGTLASWSIRPPFARFSCSLVRPAVRGVPQSSGLFRRPFMPRHLPLCVPLGVYLQTHSPMTPNGGRMSFRHTIKGRSDRFRAHDDSGRLIVLPLRGNGPVPCWTHEELVAAAGAKLRRRIMVRGEKRDTARSDLCVLMPARHFTLPTSYGGLFVERLPLTLTLGKPVQEARPVAITARHFESRPMRFAVCISRRIGSRWY